MALASMSAIQAMHRNTSGMPAQECPRVNVYSTAIQTELLLALNSFKASTNICMLCSCRPRTDDDEAQRHGNHCRGQQPVSRAR